jgi:SnoaL-like domain
MTNTHMNSPTTTDRAAIVRLCTLWTPMWNSDIDLVHEIVTEDFRIWFGGAEGDPVRDDLRGPDEFAAFIDRYRATRPGVSFAMHGEPVVDVEGGRAAMVWTATLPSQDRTLGGIDAFAVENGRFARCWSVTGARALLF